MRACVCACVHELRGHHKCVHAQDLSEPPWSEGDGNDEETPAERTMLRVVFGPDVGWENASGCFWS